MKYVLYTDTSGNWRWRLVASNNRIIANSGEGYYNRQDCISAVNLVKGSSTAPITDA